MEAVVTAKYTPAEFDLVRRALAAYKSQNEELMGMKSSAPADTKREARQEAFLAGEMLKKVA
jgi:hypothetical protein